MLEVDYDTFMRMFEEKDIGKVEVTDSQIIFTNKENTVIFTTGAMNDQTLTWRLYESGARFAQNIERTMSPLMSFLLTFIIPQKNGKFSCQTPGNMVTCLLLSHSAVPHFLRESSRNGSPGSMVKRLRHRPFTAVTRVRFPLESFTLHGPLAQLVRATGS